MRARRMTAVQARDRRAKKMAIGLGVVFLAVAAIQGPKLWKQMHPGGGTLAVNSGTASETPSPAIAGATAAAVNAAAAAAAGRLQNFSHLPLKDPFRAQVVDPASGSSPSAGATSAQAKPKPKPKATKQQPTPGGPVEFSSTLTPPDAALIRTNGRRQVVAIGDGFPSSQPLFKLVALGKKGVRIGVLGGSFTSGIPTLMLPKGRAITLANQADGSKYVLELVRLTTATPTATTAVP